MGEVMKKGVFLAKDVASIVCPVDGSNPAPVVVRVAKTIRTKVSVALPIAGRKPKTTMTYFTVFPEPPVTENHGRNVEPEMQISSGSGFAKTSDLFMLVITLIHIHVISREFVVLQRPSVKA